MFKRLTFATVLLSLSMHSYAEKATIDMAYDRDFEGRFQHFDQQGNLLFEDNGVTGKFDFTINYGSLFASKAFNREHWFADVVVMYLWQGETGSGLPSHHEFSWTENTWYTPRGIKTCTIVSSIYDECDTNNKRNWIYLSSENFTYEFDLLETQFAGVVMIDIGKEHDIPMVSAMNIESVEEDGTFSVSSIDTDNDGIPGTMLLSGPYANQTLSFDGQQIPATIRDTAYVRTVAFSGPDNHQTSERFTIGRSQYIKRKRVGTRLFQKARYWEVYVDAPGFSTTKSILSDRSKKRSQKKATRYINQLIREKLSAGFTLLSDKINYQ